MSKTLKIVIIVALVLAVGGIIVLKQDRTTAYDSGYSIAQHQAGKNLPKLIDLGADKCIPCKMMAPILEGLRREYEGRMEVIFIDVWKNQDAGGQYGIRLIPTQIFFDASGKELYRHEGFFAKEDILAKWRELGINFN